MNHVLWLGMIATALVPACASTAATGDTFVQSRGGEIARWETTRDGSLRIPLASGLTWGPASTSSSLLSIRAEEGPTFIVVTRISPTTEDVTDFACAEAHRAQIVEATTKGGVIITPPQIARDSIGGRTRPRLHYAVPLQGRTSSTPVAQELSSWTYFVDPHAPATCLAIGVTTIVHARADDPSQPDAEELHRLERVFALAAEGATLP